MSHLVLFQLHLHAFASMHGLPLSLAKATYSTYQGFQYQTSLALGAKKTTPSFSVDDLVFYLKNATGAPYASVEVTGPGFVSVTVRPAPFTPTQRTPKRVIVDYCGANVAKKMHIGHTRSMFIGDFVARAHRQAGDLVSPVNHVGDWGNQFGGLLLFLMENPGHGRDNESLTQAYKQAQHLQKTDALFAARAAQTAIGLQQDRTPELVVLWQAVSNVSLAEAYRTFEELGLLMDASHTRGESAYAPLCAALLETLLSSGVATRSDDGSVVCFFENQPPLVLQKSNGNFLYALYDLAALSWRQTHLQPDCVVYVVDKRQTLHFEQVFDVARRAQLVKPSTELVHLGFGSIVGTDGKPLKTKEGDSLYLDDLMADGRAAVAALPQVQAIEPSRREHVLNSTLVGGMKFYDLKFNRTKDYAFDWVHVLNFAGNSAPYLQNALVRMDSLFLKLGLPFHPEMPETVDWGDAFGEDALDLLFQAHKGMELLDQTSETYASQLLTEQCVKLCQSFHGYYERNRVLGSPEQDTHVTVLTSVANTLFRMMDVLGIGWYRAKGRND